MLTSTLPRWPGDSTPRFVLDVAVGLAKLGWDIEALAPGCAEARSQDEIDGVAIRRFAYAWPESLQTLCYGGGILPNVRAKRARLALVPGFMAAAIAATRRRLSAHKPDLVHAHWIVPMGLVAALAVPSGVPLVLTVHGSDVLDMNGGVMDAVRRRVLARANVTCNGSRTEAAITPLLASGKRVVRIPMGARGPEASDAHGLALPQDRFKVAFAGRLFRGKGLDDVLDAVASFAPGERPVLFVAGTGPEADRFAARAASLGIAADVRFLGGMTHGPLLALLRDVDAVVVPTRNTEWIEAQGLVVAEAMFAGTPVIATTGGGAEDHVEDGRTGLLVPPADPAAIHDALARLMAEPERARAMAKAAQAYARDHLSWPASAQAFDSVYRNVLSVGP